MKPIRSSEKGQALIVIALAAVALFGFMGLAIDGTARYSDRRNAQNAADTAALASALAKVNALTDGDSNTPAQCPPPGGMPDASDVCVELVLAALDRADSNGYDTANSTVNVYSPPINGYYANNDDYVQVVITSHVKTTFMRVFGVTQSDNVVNAVAYMKEGRNLTDGAMIISYDPDPGCSSGVGSGGGSVDISGSGIVNLYGGGIMMNSDEVCGFTIPNCADLNITGGAGINSVATVDNIDADGCAFTPPLPENLNQDPIAIPDDVPWPDVPAECGINPPSPTKLGEVLVGTKLTGEWLIYPGYYEDFPPTDLVGNKQIIYLSSGVYCVDPKGPSLDADLSWSPTDFVALYGSTSPSTNKYHTYNLDGITLYIKSGGGFTINANNPTFLDSSTDGDYQGYLIILEGTHTAIEDCSITGGANIYINGLIFAPYCDITINGGSGTNAPINAQLIGWDIKITGNNTIDFNYDPDNQVILKRKLGLVK
jgi:Flp pilus assembly protein TadG